ncbi:hypothetical protein GOARA_048_01300 [Gordonia araii NBRC 100433]|uniref:ABC1 atypical kinase-like domain-containing protein n=1 Tax=Gordonia araii NBRC 100433 TaxID=1073574 RepID=G7H253_9ACTN|nr:AarF/ABC1/UbiB kinase family protein [Gordonia araii]NNG97261.1 AarF/ABC1/UbiB kinase family protein [Gordonia araii NBRC 100433]GAB09928.1 hypothetical protein GOARA_048_01300 [Gordonia araii NBRC 100433]
MTNVRQGRVRRGATLGRLAAREAARQARVRMAMLGRSDRARDVLAERSTLAAAEQIVDVLGHLKGGAMKLGQMLSVLDLDMIPESHRDVFRQRLASLRDQAPKVPFPAMRGLIEDELGPLDTVFASFEPTPIAAASIGQVYRGTLHDGRVVAVKVQYPGIETAIRSDIRNLALFAKMWKSLWPGIDSSGIVSELATTLENELDYRLEARNQHHLAGAYRGHPFIVIPDVIPEHSTHRVLTTEYFDGVGFDEIRQRSAAERDHVGELVFRFYVGSIFDRAEFCGDPHPGNILLGADGRLCIVDFGLYIHMDPARVELEKQTLRFAQAGAGDDLLDLLAENGILTDPSSVSGEQFVDYIASAAGWHLIDDELTITPEVATSAVVNAIDIREPQFRSIRKQNLPPEHVMSRRTEFFTFGLLGQLAATNNWHRISEEWVDGATPATEIGRRIAEWENARDGRSGRD